MGIDVTAPQHCCAPLSRQPPLPLDSYDLAWGHLPSEQNLRIQHGNLAQVFFSNVPFDIEEASF